MRTLLLTCAALGALALPAVAAARPDSGLAGGTIVIRSADNGDGIGERARPVATLVVTGFVIGRVTEEGRVEIFDVDPTDRSTPEVNGAASQTSVAYTGSDGVTVDGTQWTGSDFRFRAVDGTFRVVIWGSGVYVFASGSGTVWLTGNPDAPKADGQYSLSGGSWTSLPARGQFPISN